MMADRTVGISKSSADHAKAKRPMQSLQRSIHSTMRSSQGDGRVGVRQPLFPSALRDRKTVWSQSIMDHWST